MHIHLCIYAHVHAYTQITKKNSFEIHICQVCCLVHITFNVFNTSIVALTDTLRTIRDVIG